MRLTRHQQPRQIFLRRQSEPFAGLEFLTLQHRQGVGVHALLDSVIPRSCIELALLLGITRRDHLTMYLLVLRFLNLLRLHKRSLLSTLFLLRLCQVLLGQDPLRWA